MTFDGTYLSTVIDVGDPTSTGRVRLSIPKVLGSARSEWAVPSSARSAVPMVGDRVLAAFDGGDVTSPVYFSTGPSVGGTMDFSTSAIQFYEAFGVTPAINAGPDPLWLQGTSITAMNPLQINESWTNYNGWLGAPTGSMSKTGNLYAAGGLQVGGSISSGGVTLPNVYMGNASVVFTAGVGTLTYGSIGFTPTAVACFPVLGATPVILSASAAPGATSVGVKAWTATVAAGSTVATFTGTLAQILFIAAG